MSKRKLPENFESPTAKALVAHAEAMMRVPAGEQFIAARDSILWMALLDIARWIERQEDRDRG